MKNWLYIPSDQKNCFELMEKAANMVITKDKAYPNQQFRGIGAVAKAVYENRIFAFRYKRLFKAKLGDILGGAISFSGILLIYQNQIKRFSWREITSCKVNITTIINNSPNGRSYSYTIDLGFGPEEMFVMNPNGVVFNEFGGGASLKMAHTADADDEKIAELFAFYYNRVRSENSNFFLEKNDKRIYLHYPINLEYKEEILRRFTSTPGLLFKKKLSFQRLELSPKEIIFYKRKRKKTTAIIHWNNIDRIVVALGASYSIWILYYKEGIDYTHEFIWIKSWNPEPAITLENNVIEKQQRQMVLPLCWLQMHQ